MTSGCSTMFFFVTAVAFLSFSFTVTAQSSDGYKSAMDVVKDVYLMKNEKEFRNYINAVKKYKLETYAHLAKCPKKCHKGLYKKALLMQSKFNKLTEGAKGFIYQIIGYAIEELDKKGSQKGHIESIHKDFDILRVDKNSCEGLLNAFPELKKLEDIIGEAYRRLLSSSAVFNSNAIPRLRSNSSVGSALKVKGFSVTV